ncbi:MAG: META domain-containing protein [Chloroflexota bacterium]
MSDLGEPGILISVEADRFSVAPGGTLEIPVVLKNQNPAPDQVRITVQGIPLPWVSTDQPVVLVQPGEERCITLIVQPPAPPNANAGRHLLRINAASTFNPQRSTETQLILTVAGFEVTGRVGVLMNGVQYAVIPGEKLAVPVVLSNQGLGADTFHLESADLPPGWATIDPAAWTLEAGEVVNGALLIQPARSSASRAGRYPFTIHVKSEHAPEQNVAIGCTLTVGAFTEIQSQLFAPVPERSQPAHVRLANQSNVPATVSVRWESPEETLAFEPAEPQQVNLGLDESTEVPYTARPLRRYWVGSQKDHPYLVTIQAGGMADQALRGAVRQKALMPPWLAVFGGVLLALCCLLAGLALLAPAGIFSRATPTLAVTNTPMPTATQSQVDQRPMLVDRNWFLISYNNSNSRPAAQEPFTRFNPDGTLIGFTGCKNFNGAYQTQLNRLTIASVNLSGGACSEPALQVQEDVLLAILRSARSYLVADTTLQIDGDAGFANYSLTPPQRPQDVPPPQARIQVPPQAFVGEIVTFDGSRSTGQATLVAWQWEFGDGHRASGRVVQHAIGGPGTFAVKLTVTDQRGQTNTTTQPILILPRPTAVPPPTEAPPAPPTATFPPPPTSEPPAPPTEAPRPTEAPPPTEIPQPEINPPQAAVQAPGSAYIGEPVILDAGRSAAGSSPLVSYTWSFGNGAGQPASPNPQTTAIYNTTGMYEITVVVADANGLTDSAVSIITINARLDTHAWTLSTINGQPLLPGTAITLQFLDGRLAGFAGCNDYSGRYTAADHGDGTFAVGVDRLTTGRRSCPDEIMTQEDALQAALQAVTTAAIQENRLILSGPDIQLVFYLITGP